MGTVWVRRKASIAKKEPRWRKCGQCKAQFCVAGKTGVTFGGFRVKFCPNCGAGEEKVQRWILGDPPKPDQWY